MMTETSITVSPSEGAPHVKSDPGQGQGGVTLNLDYFKTVPGILKLIQAKKHLLMARKQTVEMAEPNQPISYDFSLFESFFGVICMAASSPARLSATNWFLFVVVSCFISTVIWIFVYLLSIRDALKLPINWTLTELMNTIIKTVLYVTAFISQLSAWSPIHHSSPLRDPNLTAGCFGLFNSIAYAAGVYYLYNDWKYFQSNSGP